MKARSSRGVWVAAVAVLALAGGVIVGVPWLNERLAQGKMTPTLNRARQLQIAAQQMDLDLVHAGEAPSGFPADLGAKSFAEYRAKLVRAGYLSADDAAQIARGLRLTNLSRRDPSETAFILGDLPGGGFTVLTWSGVAGVFKRASDGDGLRLPPRQPAILPEE